MAEPEPPTQRIFPQWRVIAIVFAVLTLGLGVWYFVAFRDDYTILYSDVRPNDASAMTADLGRHGIRYRLADNGREILVPASQLEQARSAIDTASATPRGVDGFELFDQSDMGLNEFAERIRYQRAIQGELERTIMMMDGVASARVHISMPDRSVFRSEQQNAGAAVTVVMHAPENEIQARVEGIQRLVAAAVTGINASDVVVLNGSGEVLSPRVAITTVSNTLLGGGDDQTRRTAIDLVTQVMRQALPGLRFEVSIEQAQVIAQAPASAPAATPGANSAPTPAPATIDRPVFTRIVKVATEGALSDPEKQRVRALLHAAGLTDGSSEQTVVFSVGLSDDAILAQPSSTTLAAAGASPIAHVATPNSHADRLSMFTVITWIFALIIIGGGAFLLWRRRSARTLSAADRNQFASRLSAALRAQTEGDVA